MLVVIHGEGQVEGTAQQQRLLREALGHAPAQGIVPTFQLTTVEISSTRYDAKLEMFLLQHPSWLDQLRIPGNETGTGLPEPNGSSFCRSSQKSCLTSSSEISAS